MLFIDTLTIICYYKAKYKFEVTNNENTILRCFSSMQSLIRDGSAWSGKSAVRNQALHFQIKIQT